MNDLHERIPMKLKLAHYPIGRVVLHMVCLAQDHKLRWHWAGIRREFYALDQESERKFRWDRKSDA